MADDVRASTSIPLPKRIERPTKNHIQFISLKSFPDGLLDGTSITSLAQLAPHDLSSCRHRQVVDELDSTRILIGRETIAHLY